MIGGAIIGQGTYGCAVNPPFLCKGQSRLSRKEKESQQVGKITLNTDAATEIYISKHLRKIPQWSSYFVLVETETCKPLALGRTENWQQCGITEQAAPKELSQVVSNYGGVSFSSLGRVQFRQNTGFFFQFMEHLLESGALLALNGVVHFDLHRSNVLLDRKGTPKIMDFGMSFLESDIRENVINDRWKMYDPSFDSETPEITVITGTRKGMALDVAIRDVISRKPVLKEAEVLFNTNREQMTQRLTNFFQKSKSFHEKNWVAFFKVYWPVFDSFSIGAILLNVLKVLLTIPEFVEFPRWKTEGTRILYILKGMLDVDPSERFDCVEALALYDPLSDVLKNSEAWLAARKDQRS